MSKQKIAILGGGMAGLSAAYQLTKTQALRDLHEVTVYQMGWRLGGKGASGRESDSDPGMGAWTGRSLEHGLHVWFGMYENTFQMLQEVYAVRDPGTGWALATWRDAVKPQNFTPIGTRDANGAWRYWPLTWATNGGVPGDGTLLPTLVQALATLIGWIILFLTGKDQPNAAAALAAAGPPPPHTPIEPKPSAALDAARTQLRSVAGLVGEATRDGLDKALDLIVWARDAHASLVSAGARPGDDDTIAHQALVIFAAAAKGLAEDIILPDAPLVSLDDLELRAWLIKHGADPQIVATSCVVRVAYDTMFQYVDGDAARPNLAAGTGIGTMIRLGATYKGSCMWEVQAGMGEVIVGPLYDHLRAAGVQFKFFHKVTRIEPDAANPADPHPPVATIRFDRQAELAGGEYLPVVRRDGFVLWPSHPDWSQLADGAAMQAAGVNFESHWCAWPAAGDVVLEKGRDFDVVVLAIALGALKQLNDEDPSLCAPLMARNAKFAAWIDSIGIVPNMGVQLWCKPTTSGLGWTAGKAATVAGPEYLNIWADMTQVIRFENWGANPPGSLHYLTGTYSTTLYRQPRSSVGTPAAAAAELRQQTVDWLNTWGGVLWPTARVGGTFDWDVLEAPAEVQGEARLERQYLRANVDPTECTTLSGSGTTRFRLHAGESGFPNLILAGEGTAMGLPTSFEGAVMSGAAASRAICGLPETIIGYDFLELRPSQFRSAP